MRTGSREDHAVKLVSIQRPDHFVPGVDRYHVRVVPLGLNPFIFRLAPHQDMPSPGAARRQRSLRDVPVRSAARPEWLLSALAAATGTSASAQSDAMNATRVVATR